MQTLEWGNVAIQRVVETERWAFPVRMFYPTIGDEQWQRAKESFGPQLIDHAADQIILASHSYVIRVGGRVILVDTCNGDHVHKPAPHELGYLDALARAGVRPDEVDIVLCTHLHSDHVGWNMRMEGGRLVPTFPNARYVVSEIEFAAMDALHARRKRGLLEAGFSESFERSVLPLAEMGKLIQVSADHRLVHELDHGVRLVPSHGHTPGHVSVQVEGAGSRAILSGDTIHHPLQFENVDMPMMADADPAAAAKVRRQLVETQADTGTVILPAHFPAPTAGRIRSVAGRFHYDWLD